MKVAGFDYTRAQSVEHAQALLESTGDEAKLIAGGQSLVPMMAMRLARPSHLIDINRLAELKHFDIAANTVLMGATVSQSEIEDRAELLEALPLVSQAIHWVGHRQTRNRGTLGGSLAPVSYTHLTLPTILLV